MTDADRTTLMEQEAGEAGAAVARFLAANTEKLAELGEMLRTKPPSVIVTCARGSSDHAATYGKYVLETLTGVPVSSAAMSVASVYRAPVATPSLCIAISQSGRSPDLLATIQEQKAAGSHIVALVNDEESPLADMADTLLALKAGPERSVAATKSYIVSLAALAAIAAYWTDDDQLISAIATLPDLLPRAFALDWSPALATLERANNLFVLGRGYGYGIAQEAALKLKETCALHAESFSAAEVRHGPMTIVGPGFPVLAFATSGPTGDSVRAVAREFADRGADVSIADPGAGDLPAIATHHVIEPILEIQAFYRFVNQLSLARGLDPDAPPHLSKVTQTV